MTKRVYFSALIMLFNILLWPVAGWGQYLVDFEGPGETKGSFASGTVNLSGLDWDLTEALIGTLAADWKNGARSARLRGYGTSSMTMLENKPNGLGTISFQYRRYGNDTQLDWRVEYSINNGVSWTQIGSDFIAPATDDVQTFSETVNIPGNIRIRIKRATETGTTNRRLNIDDITITDYFQVCGNESFDNLNAPTGSYSSGSFWGNDNVSWSYMEVRTVTDVDYFITNPSAGFRDSGTRFMEASVTGGIGSLEYKVRSYFTGGSASDRTIRVLVNDIEVDLFTLPAMGTVYTRQINNINIPGDFTIRFESIGSRQILIDDIVWTCFSCETPERHASNISATSITDHSATITFTKGNGTFSLMVAKEGSEVNETPSDDTSYQAEMVFGEGDNLGDNSYVVFAGENESFSLSGLLGGTTYHVKVFPFNCSGGNEVYYTENDPAAFSFTTLPSRATGLTVTCTDATSATITWNNPPGNFDGVVIGMRQSTSIPHVLSGDPSAINPNPIFGSGFEYGVADPPSSFVVYKGSGNSVTVTGLTAGVNYRIRAYTYHGTNWSSGQHTTSINNLGVPDISGLNATALNQAITLGWRNPAPECFDEVIIVAHTLNINGVPTGTYISSSRNFLDPENPAFPGGGVVVFNGIARPQTITGLTNGATYFFKVFVRNGADWSEGIEISAVPNDITLLDYGDLAILGVNTDIGAGGSIPNGTDELIFVMFKDFKQNSTLDFTDNGFERLYAGYWGTTEGVMRLTRTGIDLPAGSIIKVQGKDAASNFNIIINGVNDNDNWQITSLNGSSYFFNLNVEDQVWFMQGGVWDANEGTHKGTYAGKVLYGWTATGWKDSPGYNSTQGSTLYPGTECANTDVTGFQNKDKVKYFGEITIATPREWISRINNPSNWVGYPSNQDYENGGSFNSVLEIFPETMVENLWFGDKGVDWFDCANWGLLRTPDETTDVVLSNMTNEPVVGAGIAKVRNLTIEEFSNLTMNNELSFLEVSGDWENFGAFTAENGTVIFTGESHQTLNSTSYPIFNNLSIQNYFGVSINQDIQVRNTLSMQAGNILNEGKTITVGESVENVGNVVHIGGSIFGKLRRWVKNAYYRDYLFPIGKSDFTTHAELKFTNGPAFGGTLTAEFITPMPDNYFLAQPIEIPGDPPLIIDEVPDEGFWRIDAGNGLKNGTYTLSLAAGDIQEINVPEGIRILKRNYGDNASNYQDEYAWIPGSNQGSGFGPWQLWDDGEHSGYFIWSGTEHGHGDINTDLSSFELYGHSGQWANAQRPIEIWGDKFTFSAQMAVQFRDHGKGLSLFNKNGFGNDGEIWNFHVSDSGYGETGWDYYSDIIFTFEFTQIGPDLKATITGRSKGSNWSDQKEEIIFDQTLGGFRFYTGGAQNSDGQRNLYFNNLKIISPWAVEGTTTHLGNKRFSVAGLTNFSDFTLGGYHKDNPLPIELLSFTAKYQDGKVLLNWATGSEINNDFFTLERSRDAVNAEIIGFMDGAGNSSQTLHYQFVDHDPLPGISYYRLKQTDYDGSFEYSQWVAVQVDGLGGRLQALVISQQQGLLLRIYTPTERPIQVQLADIFGRIIFSEQLNPGSPGLIETFVPIPQTARSVLLFRITDGLDVVTGKVIR